MLLPYLSFFFDSVNLWYTKSVGFNELATCFPCCRRACAYNSIIFAYDCFRLDGLIVPPCSIVVLQRLCGQFQGAVSEIQTNLSHVADCFTSGSLAEVLLQLIKHAKSPMIEFRYQNIIVVREFE